jgi:hypothetical protein
MAPPDPDGKQKGPETTITSVDEPTWRLMHHLAETSSMSREGKAAVAHLLDRLEARLGRSWPRRLYAKRGHLFPEFVAFSGYVAVLPRLLTFAVQLEAVAEEPTFSPVLRVLKREPSSTDWQHVKLQLEVARTARAAGWGAKFEPSIPGSARKGDLLLAVGKGDRVLVETTTLFRAREDMSDESFEDALQERIGVIERQHCIQAIVDLVQRLDMDATNDWVEAIEGAAAEVRATGEAREVDGPGGVVRLQVGEIPMGTNVFSGVPRERDLSHRLGAAVAGKARQTEGPYPAWLRIDARDGLFAFTEWSRRPPSERATILAQMMRPYTDGHEHLHGIICSSGAASSLGATDPTIEDAYAETDDGFCIRRLLAPHLVRETIIVTLRRPGFDVARAWADAYSGEPAWLDNDLAALDLPPLAAFWT